jgi:DNA replication protein DnaC
MRSWEGAENPAEKVKVQRPARRIRARSPERDPALDPGRWCKLLTDANVPELVRDATLEMVRGDKAWLQGALTQPEEWLGRGFGYYIQGQLCTGKSSAAGLLIMEAVRRCEVCTWVPVRDVPGVRFMENDRLKALHERLYRSDLLVLDDIGSESYRLAGAGGAALEAVVRIMYDRNRTVVYTSNLAWQTFANTYPASLVSVIRRRSWPVTMTERWPEAPY